VTEFGFKFALGQMLAGLIFVAVVGVGALLAYWITNRRKR